MIDSIRTESLDHCRRSQTKPEVIFDYFGRGVVTSVDWDLENVCGTPPSSGTHISFEKARNKRRWRPKVWRILEFGMTLMCSHRKYVYVNMYYSRISG